MRTDKQGEVDEPDRKDELIRDIVRFRRHVTASRAAEDERRRAEKEQAKREDRYERMFGRMSLPVCICEIIRDRYGTPRGYQFRESNRAFERLLGRRKKQIAGKAVLDVLNWLGRDARQLLDSVAVRGVGRTLVAYRQAKERECYEVSVSRTQLDEMTMSFADVTERWARESSLAEREGIYSSVLENQDIMICRYGPDGTLVYANRAYRDYFAVAPEEELLAHSFMTCIPEEDRELVSRVHKSLGQSNPAVTYRHRVRIPDGGTRWLEWTDSAVLGAHGEILDYQATGRDVTARKEDEEEAVKQQADAERVMEQLDEALEAEQEKLRREREVRREAEETLAGMEDRLKKLLGGKILPGSVSICGECKRILDEDQNWLPFEIYMRDHTDIGISSSTCPYCKKRNYPAFYGGAEGNDAGPKESRSVPAQQSGDSSDDEDLPLRSNHG